MSKRNKGRVIFRAAFLFVVVFGGMMGAAIVLHPESALPNGWNPTRPLAVYDQVTPLTGWKLRRAANDPQTCLAVLQSAATIAEISPITSENPNCGAATGLTITGVAGTGIRDLQTSCAVALRLAMWTRHGVQPAALAILGQDLESIQHQGSYNCRRMRTSSGGSSRWSTHATAEAIDVRGFRLADGARIALIDNWDDGTSKGAFLKAVHAAACKWFVTTLGPDFNRLHADHFHLQARGWGTCR